MVSYSLLMCSYTDKISMLPLDTIESHTKGMYQMMKKMRAFMEYTCDVSSPETYKKFEEEKAYAYDINSPLVVNTG